MPTYTITDATNNIAVTQSGVVIETIAKEAVVLQVILAGESLNKSGVDELWIQHDGKYSTEIPYNDVTVASASPSSVEDFRVKVLALLNTNGIYSGGGGGSSDLTYPIELTRSEATTKNADNSGDGSFIDGQLYRITNPASPLVNIVLLARKDYAGNPRLSPSGIAEIATTTGYMAVECGYNPYTNAISYIYDLKNNVRLSGTTDYANWPWDHANYTNLDFNGLSYSFVDADSLDNFGACYLHDCSGRGNTISLISSGIRNCKDIGINSYVELIGTSSALSFIKESDFKYGSSIVLNNDSNITGARIGNGFSINYIESSPIYFVGGTLENFLVVQNDYSQTLTNCIFGNGYQYSPTKDYDNVDFSKGWLQMDFVTSQFSTDPPSVDIKVNDFGATHPNDTKTDGTGRYLFYYNLGGEEWPETKCAITTPGTAVDTSGNVVGLVGAAITDPTGQIDLSTSVGTTPTDGILLNALITVKKFLDKI